MDEESIFLAALQMLAPQERAAYLDEVCANQPGLRRNVEGLLKAHDKAGNFLQKSPAGAPAMIDYPAAEGSGSQIGPYQLLDQLGEGGFGIVFRAEQTQPVRRMVALKVLKPGMDTRQVVARFEAERQALAMMDHPNIAKVFDGGTTASGRPYFVMELVQGVPITEFCDKHQLTPRQRLELFISVCQAVQHAHQKGIIHRDLKPSNVLVAVHDARPVPKVIDFGIAKALGQGLTDKTVFTGVAQMIGTPLYMSPEQAGQCDLDVDTRSDVYSLGVLLYELLTGTPPFPKERFQQAAYDEIRRIIREEEPPKPSTRLSDLSNARTPAGEGSSAGSQISSLESVAAERQTEPGKLTRLVRGDLDWVVMKALEKDRDRRYKSASDFAEDVKCYLADQPVSAGPPTMAYRSRKFAQRNRRALILASVIACAVLVAIGTVGWAVRDRWVREYEAQRGETARQARVGGQLQLILDDVARLEAQQRWPEALDAARRASDLLAGGDVDVEMTAKVQDSIRDLEMVRAVEVVRANRSEWKGSNFDFRGAANRYAVAFKEGGIDLENLTAQEGVRRLRSRPAVVPALMPILHDWAACRHRIGDKPGAERLWNIGESVEPDPWRLKVRQAISNRDVQAVMKLAAAADLDRQPAATLIDLGSYLSAERQMDAAIGVLLLAQRLHPADFWVHFELADAYDKKGHPSLEQAAACYRTSIALRPRNTAAWNNLGGVLRQQKKLADAYACFQKAIELDGKHVVALSNLGLVFQDQAKLNEAVGQHRKAISVDPTYAGAWLDLGLAFHAQKKPTEALAAVRKGIELAPDSARGYYNLGVIHAEQKQSPEATAAYRKAIELEPRHVGALNNLGSVLLAGKKWPEAAVALRKAIEADPLFAMAHSNLGNVLLEQRDLPGAITCYRKAIALAPNYAAAHHNLGIALQMQNDTPGAVAAFKQAVALDPKNSEFQANYRKVLAPQSNSARIPYEQGKDFYVKRKWPEAITAFQKALDLDPMFAPAHRELGILYLNQNRLVEAIACFKKSAELDAKDCHGLILLAVALDRNQMVDEACAVYRETLRIESNNSTALHNYARLLAMHPDAKSRNPAEALKLAKQAIGMAPARWDWWNTLGIAAYRAGAWKESLAAIEKSMELSKGGDAGDFLVIALVHYRLDNKEEARKWFDRTQHWLKTNNLRHDQPRLHDEAAELIGLKK